MLGDFQKKLDNLWLICSFDGHLRTYVNSYLATVISLVLYSLLMMYIGFGWLRHVWWTIAAINSDCNVVLESIICFHLSMQEDDFVEHTRGQCHVFELMVKLLTIV